jgi:hypothetical protein
MEVLKVNLVEYIIRRQTPPTGHVNLRVTVSNLIPYTQMVAQIVVMNNYYVGPPSLKISFTTQEGGM